MLACPACAAPVEATRIYTSVPVTCPACGVRYTLDTAGRKVDTKLGLTFSFTIIGAVMGFAMKFWPVSAALAAIAVVTVVAIAIRPAMVRRAGRLVRFEG